MTSSDARPKWWQLYLTFPLLIILFALDSHLKISTRGHQVVQIGILLIVYGLVHLWLKANSTALSRMDQRPYHGTVTVVRVPPYKLSDTGEDKSQVFCLPDSEIKGVLSNTFEMDYIDAEFIRADEEVEEAKKE